MRADGDQGRGDGDGRREERTYGAANPALTAVVTGQVAGGDTLDYTLATTAVQLSPRRKLPDHGHARNQPELRRDQDRCAADGDQGRGDGDGQREEPVLRRGQPGADGGGDGQVANGDALDYTLATTAVQLSPRRNLPD